MCTSAPASGPGALAKAAAAAGVGLGIGVGVLAWRQLSAGEGSSGPSANWASEDVDVPRSTLTARYVFKKCLGKGGFGDVWLAVELATGKRVAVKKMSLENQSRAMVEQEVSALRRCGIHPNVGTLLEVLWVKPDAENRSTEAYLVLELATGGGMFERLVSEGAYTEKLASAMMQQVARAIYHLHSRGIIHRDIKPENIVFETAEPGSGVQVIDFGTAVILEEENAKVVAGGRIGTWSYWAPEMLNRVPYDHAVDMWSLGVLMYILLVGFHPFDPSGTATEEQMLTNMKARCMVHGMVHGAWHGASLPQCLVYMRVNPPHDMVPHCIITQCA